MRTELLGQTVIIRRSSLLADWRAGRARQAGTTADALTLTAAGSVVATMPHAVRHRQKSDTLPSAPLQAAPVQGGGADHDRQRGASPDP